MKHLTKKKFFIFIITTMMFSLLTESAYSQNCNKRTPCPFGYTCVKGNCKRILPWINETGNGVFLESVSSNSGSQQAAISFSLDKPEKISAKIFDMTGRLVKTLADKIFEHGEHKLQWDAAGVNSGIYIVQLNTGTYSETKKISVIK